MSNETKKEPMSVVKKMMIALVGGLAVGLLFLFLRRMAEKPALFLKIAGEIEKWIWTGGRWDPSV